MRWWPALLGLIVGYAMIRMGLAAGSDTQEQWLLATRWTARAALPFLLIAFCASSLARLWPHPVSRALLRDRRWWGLGFAGVHSAHLCGLTNYFATLGEPIPTLALIGGGGAYVLMYAMVLTSFGAAQRAMGIWWQRLHRIGITYLMVIFAVSYVGKAATWAEPLVSLPYAVLALGAFALRFKAMRQADQARTHSA